MPKKLRNAVTKLMKQEGYGEGYKYAHGFEDAVVPGETYLPEELEGAVLYEPTERGEEHASRNASPTCESARRATTRCAERGAHRKPMEGEKVLGSVSTDQTFLPFMAPAPSPDTARPLQSLREPLLAESAQRALQLSQCMRVALLACRVHARREPRFASSTRPSFSSICPHMRYMGT